MTQFRKRIALPLLTIAGFLLFGTVFYHFAEGWSLFDSFYMTAMTLTTVGYGDFIPTHAFSKFVTICLAFSGIGLVFYSMSLISQHYYQRAIERHAHDVIEKTTEAIRSEELKKQKWWRWVFGRKRKVE
jgi:voltage-gated potassium channel